jgi:hypothetical protein
VESSAISLVSGAGAHAPVPGTRAAPPGQATPPAHPSPAPEHGPSDAEFLASQAIGQATASGPALRETYARFSVDPDTNEVRVDIIDAANKQVIRTIPGDDLRRMAREYRASNGFVLDSTA